MIIYSSVFCIFVLFLFLTPLRRNVPGQALYLTSVQQVRNAIGRIVPSFALTKDAASERLTTLVKLTPTGNLVAGAMARTAIGFVVNPLTVVKARFEVRTPPPGCYRVFRLGQTGWPASATGRHGE